MNAAKKELSENRELITCIYKKYKNYMFSVANKYAQNPGDCDDIIQDAVMRLMQNTSALKRIEGAQLVTYINLTVRSAALDYFDKLSNYQKRFADQSLEQAVTLNEIKLSLNTVEEIILNNERNQTVTNAVQRLPERIRLLIIGKYYLELDDEELLTLMGYKKDSLRTVMNRARRILLKELEKEGINDERKDQPL